MRTKYIIPHVIVAACVFALASPALSQMGPELLPPPQRNATPAPEAASVPSATSEPWTPPEQSVIAAPSSPSATPNEEVLPLPDSTGSALGASTGESNLPDDGLIGFEDQSDWYQPTYWFGSTPWDTGIELGLNGSSGTSDSLSIRTGGYIKRESRFSKLDLNTNFNRTTDSGVATQNNAQFEVRNDWLLDDKSPWTLYGTSNVFYDEFQAFDLQVSGNTGIGYRFVHEPGLELMTRFGAGTSREIGGPDDRWVPESLVGLEYSQQLSTAQKFYGKLDYYPEWEEVGEYRLVADSGWEIEFVQPSNLSLKISASDRYDSTPNGADPHLLNYSVLLLLKL